MVAVIVPFEIDLDLLFCTIPILGQFLNRFGKITVKFVLRDAAKRIKGRMHT